MKKNYTEFTNFKRVMAKMECAKKIDEENRRKRTSAKDKKEKN